MRVFAKMSGWAFVGQIKQLHFFLESLQTRESLWDTKIPSYENRNTKILVNVCGSQWTRDEPTTYVVCAQLFLHCALIKWP